MVTKRQLDKQLKKIGCDFHLWGRGEIKELRRVMDEDEVLQHCVNGHYEAGFAMLVATNLRLLLIDRKPMFLTIEAIWYDKVGQVDFSNRMLNATLCISTPNKELRFTSWNNARMHEVMLYTQRKMVAAKEEEEEPKKHNRVQEPETAATQPQPATPAYEQPQPNYGYAASPASSWTNMPPLHPQSRLRWPALPSPLSGARLYSLNLPFSRRRYYAPDAD